MLEGLKDLFINNKETIFTISKSVIVMYLSNRAVDKITRGLLVNSELKVKNINNINLSKMLMLKNDSVTYGKKEKYVDKLKDFENILNKNFNDYLLINFYNNINSLDTVNKKFKDSKFNLCHTIGNYNSSKNIISLENMDDSTLNHELFHMASTVKDGKVIHCGFSYTNIKKLFSIGNGINEGYTELMNIRYASPDSNSYFYNRNVALLLEEIVSKEKMEKLYLTGDLYGLIYELSNYASYDDVMKFLTYSDFYLRYINDSEVLKHKQNKISNCIYYTYEFLYKCYKNKISNDDDYEEKMSKFMSTMDVIKNGEEKSKK